MRARFRIELLADQHHRAAFQSGIDPLDRYFREQVTQDIRRRAASCYVALNQETGQIAGYYTLSASAVPLEDMPEELVKRLPRYPSVPVALMGRLAVDKPFHGQKLGAALLWDAATRAARSEVIVYALVVDAKDARAEAFYRHHGFAFYGSQSRKLILPLAKFKAPPG